MSTAGHSSPGELPANLAVCLATAPVLLSFEAPHVTIPEKAIASVNSSSAVRASTLPLSRSAIRRMAVSPCNSPAKHFPARRSPAWKKLLPLLSCAAASRAVPSAVLRRINRTLASLPCSPSSAAFPSALFRRSPEFPAISARPPAARPCMKLCEVLRSKRAAIAAQSFSPRSVPASCSAEAGSPPAIELFVPRHARGRNQNTCATPPTLKAMSQELETEYEKLNTLSSRSRPCPNRETNVRRGHHASLQRRPARITNRIPAERDNGVNEL